MSHTHLNISQNTRLKFTTILILLIFAMGCSPEDDRNVGDIPFNEEWDDVNFKICDETDIQQYYVRYSSDTPPGYKGEKRGLEKIILNQYHYVPSEKENGYVSIRFIVNCEGKPGRFRTEEMDFDYKPVTFDKKITNQLLDIVKNLNDWIPRKRNGESLDFYQYLTFKIEKGQIVKILP
jgi:hypothetical protein